MNEIDAITRMREMRGIRIYEMNNQASGILSSLWDLFSAGALGGFFSILVLYLFLRRLSPHFTSWGSLCSELTNNFDCVYYSIDKQ